MPRIRSNLKSILDERNLSIRQVSREIDHDFRSLRQMYNDEMERYPRDLLSKLCDYLDLPLNEILIMEKKNPQT